jgi:hypothetical protein
MAAMTEFGKIEPKDCIVIWIDEAGNICWSSSTNQMTLKMGMVEFLRTKLKQQAVSE